MITNHATAFATLIFAAMAGIGGVIRVLQNERYYRWCKRNQKRRTNVPPE